MDGDSYLIQYLHRSDIKKKQLEKKKLFIKEDNYIPRPPSVWLNTNKFKPKYMEVTKPPTLVVRATSSSASEKKVDPKEGSVGGKVAEVEKTTANDSKVTNRCQSQSDCHEIKEAWTEQNLPASAQSIKKTPFSLFNFNRKFRKDQKLSNDQSDGRSFSKMFSKSSHFSESMSSTATYVKKPSTSLRKKIFKNANNGFLAQSLNCSSGAFRETFIIDAAETTALQGECFEITALEQSTTEPQQNPTEPLGNSTQSLRSPAEPPQNSPKSLQNSTEPLRNSSNPSRHSMETLQNPTKSPSNPSKLQQNPMELLQNPLQPPQNPTELKQNPIKLQKPSIKFPQNPKEHLKCDNMTEKALEKEIPIVKESKNQINDAMSQSDSKAATKPATGVLLKKEHGKFKLQSPDGENMNSKVEESASQRELRTENPSLNEEKYEDNGLRSMKEAFNDARDIGLLNISTNSDANNSSASNDVIKPSRDPNKIVGDNLKCSHLNDDTLRCVTTIQPKQLLVDERASKEMTAAKISTEIAAEKFGVGNSKDKIYSMSQRSKDLSQSLIEETSSLNPLKSELQHKISELKNNERVNSPEVFSLKSEGVKEPLHCNSSRAPSRSERKLKSRLQKLRSRESTGKEQRNFTLNDQPARGAKNLLSLQFDLPYKATLVKRETNVGQKLHRERKERESIFGVPQLVAVAPVKTSSKPIMPRPRRRSILEFFHDKISTKNESESSEEDTTEVLPEEKQPPNNLDIIVDLKQSDSQKQRFQGLHSRIHASSNHPKALECTPFSSPKIFRRQYDSPPANRSSSSVAKSATYNINEKSSLYKKIEELRNLKKSRKMFKNLPIFNIDVDSLNEQAENGDASISQEKTYKKQLPAILKLRKNISWKRDEWLGRLDKHHVTSQNTLCINSSSTPQIETKRNQMHDDQTIISPVNMTSIRAQTPLLPSVLQELREKQQTIKWTNKMGNVFQVTAENGRYGNITCCKDPTYISHHVVPPKKRTEKVKNATKQRKELAFKKWQDLSESVSHHCRSIRPAARAKRLRHKKGVARTKEEVVVVFTNGAGNEISFTC